MTNPVDTSKDHLQPQQVAVFSVCTGLSAESDAEYSNLLGREAAGVRHKVQPLGRHRKFVG